MVRMMTSACQVWGSDTMLIVQSKLIKTLLNTMSIMIMSHTASIKK